MTLGRVASPLAGRTGTGYRGVRWRVALGAAVFAMLLVAPAASLASDAPHVSPEDGPDACAMCHRTHTAPGVVSYPMAGSWETTGSALIVAQPSDTGDQALCLTCHGVDGLGSVLDVQGELLRSSVHSMAPDPSAYGPSPKQCSSCHDAHGAEKDPVTEQPFARLLRAFTSDGTAFYQGEEYCATCHFESRTAEDNRFGGLDVYAQTAHADRIASPASGTEITCSACHASHGSDIAPLIRAELLPPSAPATWTVDPASPRTLCYGCHEEALVTYGGDGPYEDSIHGLSGVSVAVSAEWTGSEETTRAAGECQNCHNPMGVDDGDGGLVPKLAEVEGRELCYGCHNPALAASDGVVDMASIGVRPYEPGEEGAELLVSWDPERLPLAYSALHVYTQERGTAAPRALEGPRRYLSGYRSGALAAGDIDGLGTLELVVADPAAPLLRVARFDDLAGLATTAHSIEETAAASFLAVGDFAAGGTVEVAVVSTEGSGASHLTIYRFDDILEKFDRVAGPVGVGLNASGLAAGDLGGARRSLVVTSLTADETQPGEVRVIRESGVTPGQLVVEGPYATGRAPRGPSVGNVWSATPAANEIVYANSGETTGTVSIISAAGSELASIDATLTPGGSSAWDTAVGAFLPGGSTGIGVAMRSETGQNGVVVFEADGVAFGSPVPTGARAVTSSLAVGDVNGDGTVQLIAAGAGVLSEVAGQSVTPAVHVLAIDGSSTALEIVDTRWAGGTEMAGGTPALAVADLGAVGRSRHPASAIPGAHDSAEEAGFARHAECVDCHNVHAMTADAASAPAAYGLIAGTWGVSATDQLVEGIDHEYQLCFKCHASAGWGGSPRDIAAEVDEGNLSVHATFGPSATAENAPVTFEAGWSVDSVLYCVDCHGNAAAPTEAAGPHVSPAAPLLRGGFLATRPAEDALLCYDCHRRDVYREGVAGSGFRDQVAGELHELHGGGASGLGIGCEACHVSHGSPTEYHLIRGGLGYAHAATGGSCAAAGCHAAPRTYER